MRRGIRDYTSDRNAEPFSVLVRDPGDGIQAIRDVVLQVRAIVVDGDLRRVEQRSQRGAGEKVIELLLRDRQSEASCARTGASESCRYQEARRPCPVISRASTTAS